MRKLRVGLLMLLLLLLEMLLLLSDQRISDGLFLLLGDFAGVQADVLLQHDGVGELLVANGTLMQHAKRGFRFMNSHMRLQISLCCKSPPTEFTSKRPFAGVRAIMHLQSALATKYAITNTALVRVGQLVLYVVYQLLQLGCFWSGNLHVLF